MNNNAKRHPRFGRAVRQERLRNGWTLELASHHAGVSIKTWCRLEHGEPVRNLTLSHIDKVFGLEPGTAFDRYRLDEGFDDALQPRSSVAAPPASDDPRRKSTAELLSRVSDLSGDEVRQLRDFIAGALFALDRCNQSDEQPAQAVRHA